MDIYIGSILLFAFNFVPKGFASCDGSLLQINQNQALFSLLGTQFGGDGKTTFALPKLAAPGAGLHYAICVNGIFPSRN
jgi:microcystin-dependent protein